MSLTGKKSFHMSLVIHISTAQAFKSKSNAELPTIISARRFASEMKLVENDKTMLKAILIKVKIIAIEQAIKFLLNIPRIASILCCSLWESKLEPELLAL